MPVTRAVVAFALDQLVEGAEGMLVVSPSTSPEHRFLAGDELGTVTAGSTLDQELAAQALDRYLRLTERLDDVDDLADNLGSVSLLDLHPLDGWPGGAIFQIDGNLGAIAGIAELLVQSHDGAVSLLPTSPPSWHSGSVRGIRARGGRTVDLAWESGVLGHARIHTVADGDLVIEWDAGLRPSVLDDTGAAIVPVPVGPAPHGRARWGWRSSAGRTYELEKG